jgi:hypothetical protein
MDEIIRKSLDFIKVMNEDNTTDEADKEKKIRRQDYIDWLKRKRMKPEARDLFVKDAVATPEKWKKVLGYVSQAKSIIANDAKSKGTLKKKKDSDEKTAAGLDKLSKYFKENVLIKGGKADNMSIEDIAKKHGVSVESIEKQIEQGISIESEHVGSDTSRAREISMDHLAEFPDYYDRLNRMEDKAKKDFRIEDQITTGAQVGIIEDYEVRKQTLTSSMSDIRVDYAKGIVDSIKLYSDLIARAKGQYDMRNLVIQLEHHIEEDGIELDEAIEILDKNGREEVLSYQKEINKTKEPEDVDLSNELTKGEKKELDNEKTIEEKNEVNEEDTTFGASDVVSKYMDSFVQN